MLTSILFMLVLAAPVVPIASQPAATETQADMNAKAAGDLRTAEANMAAVLSSFQTLSAANPVASKKLQISQETWRRYVDAQLQALFPGDPVEYGSANPMCQAIIRTRFVQRRTQELETMLHPQEGDACGWHP